MTQKLREWFTPGVVMGLFGLLFNAGVTWGILTVKMQQSEKNDVEVRSSIKQLGEAVDKRMDRFEGRLDGMAKDGAELIRLQERNTQLKDSIGELRGDFAAQIKSVKDSQEIATMQAQKFREELYRKGVL